MDNFFHFEFSDAVANREQQRAEQPDFVHQALSSLAGLSNVQDINQRMFPPNLFDGMSSQQDTISTIHAWLQQAWLDAQTMSHRDLATQDFDLRLCGPLPWVRAMQAIALHDGLCPESLNLALDANIGFMEHHATRLLHSPDSTHRGVSPNPSVMLGAAVSARKSHITELTDGFLADAEPADAEGKPGYIKQRKITFSDATLAGIRKALKTYGRAIVSSGEASTVYETPFSGRRPGVHYLPEHVMNKLTQSEMDDAITAGVDTHLGDADHPYLMLHKISGQQDRSTLFDVAIYTIYLVCVNPKPLPTCLQEVIDTILKPATHGFQKRFWFAVTPKGLQHDDSAPVQSALTLVAKLHTWMFDHFFYHEEDSAQHKHVLDGYALHLYECCKKACEDFKAEHTDLDQYVEAKIDFRHSDLLRASHIAMRKVQFLHSIALGDSSRPPRTSPSIYEFCFALHNWRRQICLHFCYLQWMQRVGAKLLMELAAGSKSAEAQKAHYVAGEGAFTAHRHQDPQMCMYL